jgi:LVIVD repeat
MDRCETWRTMTGRGFAAALLALPVFVNAVPPPPADPVFELIGTYTTGLADPAEELTSGEVAALKGDKLFVSNASDTSVDIVDVSNPTTPTLLKRIDLSAFGTEVTSVAVGNGLVAATVEAGTSPGKLVVFSPGGTNLHSVEVGAGPDMVTFTPDGRRILVANEGEPSGYMPGDTDPPGSISVVDVRPANTLVVHTIGFTAFDPDGTQVLPAGVRIFGSSLPSLDLEPEYITVSADGRTAWVSLQENNAIAVLNLTTLTVTRIDALGYKNHSLAGAGLDASDQDGGININTWPSIFGMYQPDALAAFRIGNSNYVLSANEGDAREYDGLVEAARLRSTTTDASFGAARANNQAGRLNVTTKSPGSPSAQMQVYAFGARSFSVWNGATGALVYDSGDTLERLTAVELPANFNSNNTANNFDNRSDDKGPEPEAATVGVINGRTYGFIGFERIGGIIVVDLSDPSAPEIVQYLNNRDFSSSAIGPDSGPEVIDFVPATSSPNGRDLIVVANEITGTVSIYAVVAP